jgi:hypothetical protein
MSASPGQCPPHQGNVRLTRANHWGYHGGSRLTAAHPKTSTKVHDYYGVTLYGPTEHSFVTGGGSQKSKFLDRKTKVPLRAVGAQEYSTVVLKHLLNEGDRLFSGKRAFANKWIPKQDNAPAYTAKGQQEGVGDQNA